MTHVMQWFAATDKGTLRKVNEDSVQSYADRPDREALQQQSVALPPEQLCIVADGLGGHRGGQKASSTAVQHVARYYYRRQDTPPDQAIQQAILQASRDILTIGETDPELQQMGTTIVLVVTLNGRAYIAHVGDSRAYLLRDGRLTPLTIDDSWVQKQIQMQTLSPDQARTHAQRNLLTQYLGSKQPIEPHLRVEALQPGDVFLLCTDGVYDVLSDEELCTTLATPPANLPRVPLQLVEQALLNGTNDNVTAAVGYYGPPLAPPPQAGAAKPRLAEPFPAGILNRDLLLVALIVTGVLLVLVILGWIGFFFIQAYNNTAELPAPTAVVEQPAATATPRAAAQKVLPTTTSVAATERGTTPETPAATPAPEETADPAPAATSSPTAGATAPPPPTSPFSVTPDFPLLAVRLLADEASTDERWRAVYQDCQQRDPQGEWVRLIVARDGPTETALDMEIDAASTAVGIRAEDRVRSTCFAEAGLTEARTITVAAVGSTERLLTWTWAEPVFTPGQTYLLLYQPAPRVTVFAASEEIANADLTAAEQQALQACPPQTNPDDALVVLSNRTGSNTEALPLGMNATMSGEGEGENQASFDLPAAEGATCALMHATVQEITTNDSTTLVPVQLEAGAYYVIRL